MRPILVEPENSKKQIKEFQNFNKNENIPLVIDYGSHTIKAGWGESTTPNLVFRSLVSKTKDSKSNQSCALVATIQKEVDLFKANYRSPFERNIIQHYGLLENINDYIYQQLQAGEDGIYHPVILTECLANPEYCRTNLMEMFFECYCTPRLFLGVDSLFSYYNNIPNHNLEAYKQNTCLLISISNSTIHIIPIIKGVIQYLNIKRINVGGANCFEMLYKQLNLKYPEQRKFFDYYTVTAIQQNYTHVAFNYHDQLEYFKRGLDAFNNKCYKNKVQFQNNELFLQSEKSYLIDPMVFEFPETKIIQEEHDIQRKKEMRQKAAERLREAIQKKKAEKEIQHKKELKECEDIISIHKENSVAAQYKMEMIFGHNATLDMVKQRIIRIKIKLGLLSKETLEQDKYNLVNVSDSELNSDQRKLKRQQIMLKAAADARAEKKRLEKQKQDEQRKWKEDNPQKYLEILYEKRNKIISKLEHRKKMKEELSQRNSKLNQRRMQTIAQLGGEESNQKQQKEDNFGMNDDDWNIYRGISKDQDSDDENQELKLSEIDAELRELDPDFEDKIKQGLKNPYGLNMQEQQIIFSVNRVNAPEILFQPTISGVEQAGLSETIVFVLKKFTIEEQTILLQNILLTGGSCQIEGICDRIRNDLRPNFPENTNIIIDIVQDPVLDAWMGMRNVYKEQEKLYKEMSITKQEYDEIGIGQKLFKSNPFSNIILKYSL